jgi:hypothetical protein
MLINQKLAFAGTPNIKTKFDLTTAMEIAATNKTLFEYENKRLMTKKEELKVYKDILDTALKTGKTIKDPTLAPILAQINSIQNATVAGKTETAKEADDGMKTAKYIFERGETSAGQAGKEYSFQQKIIALENSKGFLNKKSKDYKDNILTIDKQILAVQKQQAAAANTGAAARKKEADAAAKQAEEVAESYKKGQSEATAEWSAMLTEQREMFSVYGEEQRVRGDEAIKKYRESSESIAKLQKEKEVYEQNYNQAVVMGNLTLEQRTELLKDHANVFRAIGDDEKDAIANAANALDQQTEMFIVMNKLSDMDADILRYKTDQSKLAQGLVTSTSDYVNIVKRGYDFEEQITDEYGLQIKAIEGKTKAELESIKKRRDALKEMAQFDADELRRKQLGFETEGPRSKGKMREEYAMLTGDIKSAMEAKRLYAAADREDAQKDALEKSKDLAQQTHDDMQNAVSDGLVTGFEQGGKAGIKSFLDYLKQRLIKQTADGLAEGMLKAGGDGSGFNLATLFGGGGAGGGANPAAIALAAAKSGNPLAMTPGLGGNAGAALMASVTGASKAPWTAANALAMFGAGGASAGGGRVNPYANTKANPAKALDVLGMLGLGGGGGSGAAAGAAKGGGGFLSKLLGGAGGGAGGGIMGMFSKAMPMLGMGMMLTGFLKKEPGAQSSGVEKLPQNMAPNVFGGSLDVLRGSGAFQRATFSSRNATGALAASMAERRFGDQPQQVEVTVKPSSMFDVEIAQRTGESVRRSTQGGTPNRTGFNI